MFSMLSGLSALGINNSGSILWGIQRFVSRFTEDISVWVCFLEKRAHITSSSFRGINTTLEIEGWVQRARAGK